MPWVTATLTLVRAAQRSLSADLEVRACCLRGELAAVRLQVLGTVPRGKGKGPLCCHRAGLSPRQGNVCLASCAIWSTDAALVMRDELQTTAFHLLDFTPQFSVPGRASISAESQQEKWELEAPGRVAVRHLVEGQHFALAFSLADL